MTQGRQSKTQRVLGCLVAALIALAAFAAAPAMAQSGVESEYQLPQNIPQVNESDGQGGGAGGVAGGNGPGGSATAGGAVPSLNTEASDGGGTPLILILLAAVAAICTGAAIWRLRQGAGPSEPGPGAKPSASAAGETQSL